jgi:hypothetical protein
MRFCYVAAKRTARVVHASVHREVREGRMTMNSTDRDVAVAGGRLSRPGNGRQVAMT